jgi:hypothetical protein
MRNLLCHRLVRGFLFLLAFVATGIVLWYSITSFWGRREWAAAKKALEARGERLAIADLIPPPLADDLNFAAAPAFGELFDYKLVEAPLNPRGFPATEFRVPPDSQQIAAVKSALGTPFSKGLTLPFQQTDLAAAATYYRSEGRVPSDGRPPGEVVLAALAPAQPLMEEIARYAERPGARFPVHYEEGLSATVPHVGALMTMAKYLNLRAAAFMDLGRSAEAMDDLLLILHLSDSLKSEPFLISLLVRFAILNTATQTIWEGLERGVWKDAQLAALQKRLRGYDLRAETANGLRGERASMLSVLESALGKGGFGKFLSSITEISTEGPKSKDSPGAKLVATLYPKGWGYADLAFIANVHQRWIDALEMTPGPLRPADFDFLDEEIRKWIFPTKIKHLLSALALPSLPSVVSKAVSTQAGLDEARTALALERYRFAHNDLPETLDALVPQYLEAVHVDAMTARPLRYRRLGSDNFLLWCVGWDTTDDGGQPLDQKTKKGDIVWMRLPASANSQ